jgi:hypothetical protein
MLVKSTPDYLLNRPLVKYIANVMAKGPFELKGLPVDHTIDASFELAKAIAHLPARGGARFDIVLNKVRSQSGYV